MTEEKNLTTKNETAVSVDNSGIGSGIDQDDILIPRIVIVQPMSQMNATAGKLVDTSTDEEFDEINAAFLSITKKRVMWEKDENGKPVLGTDPLCRSDNAFNGSGLPGGNCAICSMSQWGENKQRPACNLNYSSLCINLDTLIPFYLTLGGVSFTEGKKIITKAVMGKNLIYSFKVKITPFMIQGAGGKYYKFNLALGETITDENLLKDLKQMQEDLKPINVQAGETVREVKANTDTGEDTIIIEEENLDTTPDPTTTPAQEADPVQNELDKAFEENKDVFAK